MRILKIMALGLFPLLLEACSSKSNSVDTSANYNNDQSSQDTTAQGIDNDHNGIRDDIDAIIKEKYSSSPAYTKAATRYAQILQKIAITPAENEQNALEVLNDATQKVFCLVMSAPTEDEVYSGSRLIAGTFNTNNRLKNYETYERLTSGSAFTLPEDESVCQ